MKMLVVNSKKIAVVSNLIEEVPDSDDATRIDVIDKRRLKSREIQPELLVEFAKKVVEEVAPSKRPLEMNVILLDTEEISKLNEKHLSKLGPTDVLAFPIDEPDALTDDPVYLMGDVCICPEVAAEQAKDKGLDIKDEIALLLTHGILHLLGYDHYEESEEVEMKEMEKTLIRRHMKHLRVEDV